MNKRPINRGLFKDCYFAMSKHTINEMVGASTTITFILFLIYFLSGQTREGLGYPHLSLSSLQFGRRI